MDSIKKLFGTTDLYSILKLDKNKASDQKALKSGYLKAALANHPDKGTEEEREVRTQKFQIVTKIYELFQNEDLKKSYDETGEWPEAEECTIDLSSFGRLDESAILDFKKIYLESEEERQDVKKYYEESDGNILYIFENLFFANILDDEERVQSIIDDLIKKGEMKKLTKGVPSSKSKNAIIKKAQKESKEADELRKELNLDGGLDSLRIALAKNNAKRADFLDDLEKKYGAMDKNEKGKGKGSKSKSNSEHEDTPKPKKSKVENGSSSTRVTRSRGKN